MNKIIQILNKKKNTYGKCIICKGKTNFKVNQHISERLGYVRGLGHLCYDCYQDYKSELDG